MSIHLEPQPADMPGYKKVWNVSEFAKRYRLDMREENRLQKLLGPFASEQELLMNATRTPLYR
ncbi:hypothetical protein [Rhizobium sp. FY34]|uniref:hypothetical protein n=1 Tax=Rhizobium sp. FY34 TaxID=2562309 RepID=UPI0010C13F60|nr:hypothetical protein [Rhizobium sp. FY34]